MISKKKKANAPLIVFVFVFTLMTIMVVGVDFAHIMASRYQLQQQTEIIALDYASRFGTLGDGNPAVQNEGDNVLLQEEIRNNYATSLNNLAAYKLDHINLERQTGINPATGLETTITRVNTSAVIRPFFTGFIGIRRIVIHANAYARTVPHPATTPAAIPIGSDHIDIPLNPPLTGKFNSKPDIGSGRTPLADLSVQLEYPTTLHGGFFIFAKYDDNNAATNEGWADIGNYALDNGLVEQVNVNGVVMNCINSDNNRVYFQIPRNNPPIAKINVLRIYKSSAALTAGQNPCTLNNDIGFKAEANVNVEVLNGVTLTNKREWNNFNAP